MECCVPGCSSKLGQLSSKVLFYKMSASKDYLKPLKTLKRSQLLKVIKRNKGPLKTARVCTKHFFSGQSALKGSTSNSLTSLNVLPESDDAVLKIITNMPEITEEFDVPEYVNLENEKTIEMDLIHKYITNPVCDDYGYYINDHDYLGLPIIWQKTQNRHQTTSCDHNYSMKDSPACLYSDLRHFCNICQCNNLNLFRFNAHMMVHTIKNDVICQICGQRFLTTSCLNNHISTHKSICDICGIEVPTVQIFAHQEANKEQKKALESGDLYRVTRKEKVKFCVFCMKSFDKNYLKHLATHRQLANKRKKEKNDKNANLTINRKFVPLGNKI